MTEKEFCEKLADILNTEMELGMDTDLDDVDRWDSLGALALIGMCHESMGKELALDAIRSAETVRDLYELL